jgi:hypothetical protein
MNSIASSLRSKRPKLVVHRAARVPARAGHHPTINDKSMTSHPFRRVTGQPQGGLRDVVRPAGALQRLAIGDVPRREIRHLVEQLARQVESLGEDRRREIDYTLGRQDHPERCGFVTAAACSMPGKTARGSTAIIVSNLLRSSLRCRRAHRESGVVVHDVEAAQAPDRRGDCTANVRVACDVGAHAACPGAAARWRPRSASEAAIATCAPLFGEDLRGAAGDAARRTGDHATFPSSRPIADLEPQLRP